MSWKAILERGTAIDYREGQYLFYEGHKPYGLFFLTQGEVCCLKKTKDGEVCVGHVSPRCGIGLDFLISGQCYGFSARAKTSVKALFISKSHLCVDGIFLDIPTAEQETDRRYAPTVRGSG